MKTSESNNTEKNAEETHNSSSNSEIMEFIDIPKSQLKVVRLDDQYFTALGKYRLSEPTTDREKAIKDAKRMDMARLMQVMEFMYKILNETENVNN